MEVHRSLLFQLDMSSFDTSPVSCVQALYYYTTQNDNWLTKHSVKRSIRIPVLILISSWCRGHCYSDFRHPPSSFYHAHGWVYFSLSPILILMHGIEFSIDSLQVHCHGLGRSCSTSEDCLVRNALISWDEVWIPPLRRSLLVRLCLMPVFVFPYSLSYKIEVILTVSDQLSIISEEIGLTSLV